MDLKFDEALERAKIDRAEVHELLNNPAAVGLWRAQLYTARGQTIVLYARGEAAIREKVIRYCYGDSDTRLRLLADKAGFQAC